MYVLNISFNSENNLQYYKPFEFYKSYRLYFVLPLNFSGFMCWIFTYSASFSGRVGSSNMYLYTYCKSQPMFF